MQKRSIRIFLVQYYIYGVCTHIHPFSSNSSNMFEQRSAVRMSSECIISRDNGNSRFRESRKIQEIPRNMLNFVNLYGNLSQFQFFLLMKIVYSSLSGTSIKNCITVQFNLDVILAYYFRSKFCIPTLISNQSS